MNQIVVFGHSLTAGFWDTKGGWVQRLENFLNRRALEQEDEDLVFEVYNLGISGDTSADLLERMENELEARTDEDEETIVIVQIGANDSIYLKDEERVWVEKEQFEENIDQIIEEALKISDNLVFVSDFPFDPELDGIPYAPECFVDNERLKDYEQVKKRLCRENDVQYTDIFPIAERNDPSTLLEEGVHPNSEGHKLIFQEVKKKLKEEELI